MTFAQCYVNLQYSIIPIGQIVLVRKNRVLKAVCVVGYHLPIIKKQINSTANNTTISIQYFQDKE